MRNGRASGARGAPPRAPRRPLRNYTPPSRSRDGGRTPGRDPPRSAGRDLTTRGMRRRGNGYRQPRGRKQDGPGTCPHSSGHPSCPASSFTPPTYSGLRRYARGDTPRPPSGGTPQGAAQLAVAHFKAGGPVYDDALSRLGDTQGPLLLMLTTGIAAALRQELDGCEGLRVGWEAVADGTLLALLHRDTANGCRLDALTPHLTGRHVYMASPPQGHPRPALDDLIAAFHDHGILPNDTWQEVQRKTRGKDYRRRVRARLLEIRDPLRQRWNDLWLRHLDPWSPPSHLPHTCRLCGVCDTVSSAASTGANRGARCAQVAACPWPKPPAGPRRRTEEEALHRRIEGAHTPSHERAGPAGAALLWIHVHLRDPTSVAHLSHVFRP